MVYAPHQVPDGPHHAYIFYDQTQSRFKVGETRHLNRRRTDAARLALPWHLRPTLEIYHHWPFKNYYAGIHVEQATIDLLKLHGFPPIVRPDWFEIDRATMDAAIAVIDSLAKSIIDWEKRNANLDSNATYRGNPYGDYVHDTDFVTMGTVWENEDGSIEHMKPDLQEAIAYKKRVYQESRSKMPDGLARLITENGVNS